MRESPVGSGMRSNTVGRVLSNPWVWIGMLWVIGLSLGYVGLFRQAASTGSSTRPMDLIYLLLQLITLESGARKPPIPWQLEIARFGLPALAGWTVIRALMTIFWEQAMRISLRFWRDHIIICGLSGKGFNLARGFLSERRRVVILEIEETHDLREAAGQLGALVLVGDATDPTVLSQAGAGRAAALIAVAGDDGINAEVAVRANSIISQKPGDPLHCLIHIVEPGMWDLMREWAFDSEKLPDLRLDVFNVYQRAAELLLKEYPLLSPHRSETGEPRHLIVIGLGNLGRHLILHSAEQWYRGRPTPDLPLEITAVDRRASSITANLAARFPQLGSAADVRSADLEIDDPAFLRGDFLAQSVKDSPTLLAFICFDDDSLALSTALSLRRALRGSRGKIVLRMQEGDGLSELANRASDPTGDRPSLEPFMLIERTCGTDLLNEATHERLARALHEVYLRAGAVSGADREAMKPWSQLSEELRRANRRQADQIGAMLSRAGCALELLTDWGEPAAQFSSEEIEALARMEHERWCKEQREQGWRVSPGPRDNRRKTHPDLVDWGDLPEGERAKNRGPVRELPALLHQAGYRITRRQWQ